MKKCVQQSPIIPMQQEWFDNIISLIPPRLRHTSQLRDVIQELFEEVSTDFEGSMKKSIGKFEPIGFYFNKVAKFPKF